MKDKYCGLCGMPLKVVKAYSGTYNTKTGKPQIDILRICTGNGCFNEAAKNLMIVGSKYVPSRFL